MPHRVEERHAARVATRIVHDCLVFVSQPYTCIRLFELAWWWMSPYHMYCDDEVYGVGGGVVRLAVSSFVVE